jgi:hypothetical protein
MKSCEFNPSIDWLFFTDCEIPKNPPKNIEFIKFSLNKFNLLASEKLNFKIDIKKVFKICDFKPTFGVIFENFLENYDFWGHGDIDLIFGDIRKFVTEDILSKYEIITSLEAYIAGHFTLYKNNPKINNLYKEVRNYESLLQAEHYKCFDELNFNKTVNQLKQKNELKCHFQTLIKEGYYADRKFILMFDNGKIIDIKNDKEYLYFHILCYKTGFRNPKFHKLKNIFYITQYEIFYDFQMSLSRKGLIDLKRACRYFKDKANKVEARIGEIGIYLKKNNPKLYYKLTQFKK